MILKLSQGNGYEKDKLTFEDRNVYILDMYNAELWPQDAPAKTAIDSMIELKCGTQDTEYLTKLESALDHAAREFQPDLILYNAGTDILKGDPLGRSVLFCNFLADCVLCILYTALYCLL